MKKSYWLIFIILFFASCKQETTIKSSGTVKQTESEKTPPIPQTFEEVEKVDLGDCIEKKLPLIDSTSFDNHQSGKILSAHEQEVLGLEKVFAGKKVNEIGKVSIDYSISLSQNFKTLVVSYFYGENELFTCLINYDHNFHVIDWTNIAYDEIAEGFSRIQSEITQSGIVTSRINYFNEPPEIKKSVYKIDSTGKIVITN